MKQDDKFHRLSVLGPRGNTLSVIAAGAGPTLMLVHGFPLDHRLWHAQLRELSESFHVLCPELRGFGQSTLDGDYSMKDLAEDIEVIRSHFVAGKDSSSRRFALCGLSMGGYVAFEYWNKYKHYLSHLILASTKPSLDNKSGMEGRLAMAQKAMNSGTKVALGSLPGSLLSSRTTGGVRELALKIMLSVKGESIAAAQKAMSQREDFSLRLCEVSTPTLVIAGEDDSIATPELSRDWASQLPNSHLSVIPGAGHLSPLERPKQFSLLVHDFLGRGSNG